jgi:hypothetical protein
MDYTWMMPMNIWLKVNVELNIMKWRSDMEHDWIEKYNLPVCANCGYIRNDTNIHKACIGKVSVELRTATTVIQRNKRLGDLLGDVVNPDTPN